MSGPWAPGGRLRAGGRDLDWAARGPGPEEGPVLVLLHEGLGCVALWRGFPEALGAVTGLGVAAYSRAGYGRSETVPLPRPLDYMTREAVEVLPEVLDGLGVRRCVLVGHSDGATIAAIHAGAVRDPRVAGAVLMAPHVFAEGAGLAEIARARGAFETGGLRARLARYHDDPDAAFRGWCDAWLDPGFRDWDVSAVLEGIAVPVLAIQGGADPYGTLAQLEAFEARAAGRVETLVLEGCGHAPHLERSGAVLGRAAAFCAEALGTVRWPGRAYVPGRTERPAEGAFDAIRETARPGMGAGSLAASGAMRHGLAYLERGFFWEAHEVLEPVWLALPEGAEREAVRGLIQVANGRLKLRMGRPRAARRLAGIAAGLLGAEAGAFAAARAVGLEHLARLERDAG